MTESARNYENDGFRGRVSLRMLREGAFNMAYWTSELARRSGCGTACCLAGNIYLEAGVDPEKIEAGYETIAREIWAKHYGWEAAEQLDFLSVGQPEKHYKDITPQDAIDHIYSV